MRAYKLYIIGKLNIPGVDGDQLTTLLFTCSIGAGPRRHALIELVAVDTITYTPLYINSKTCMTVSTNISWNHHWNLKEQVNRCCTPAILTHFMNDNKDSFSDMVHFKFIENQ